MITRKQAELISSKLSNKELDAYFENVGISEYVRAFARGKTIEWRTDSDYRRFTKETQSARFDLPLAPFWAVREEPSEMTVSSQERELIDALRASNALLIKQVDYTNHDCTPGKHITIEADLGQDRIFRALKNVAADALERIF